METQVECLRLEGRRAVVQPEGPVARVSAKACLLYTSPSPRD